MSVLASVLVGLWGGRLLALSFRWWCTTLPISTPTCRSSPFEGSATGLGCQHQILSSWPSGSSRTLSHLDTSTSWLLLWAYLILANLSPQLRWDMLMPPLLYANFDVWFLRVVLPLLWTAAEMEWSWWFCRLLCCGSIPLLAWPPPSFPSFHLEYFLNCLKNQSVGSFHCSVWLWVIHRCERDLRPYPITEILEHAAIKIFSIVDCNLLRNSVTTDDVLPEIFLYSCWGYIGDGLRFNPLGEIFHRYNGEGVISLCGCEFVNDIDATPL
jgi:hypothetical protein